MRISSLRRASGIGFDIVLGCAVSLAHRNSRAAEAQRGIAARRLNRRRMSPKANLSLVTKFYTGSRAQFPYIVGAFGLRVSNRAAHAMRRCTEVCGYAGRCLPQSLRCSGQRFEKALLDDARVSCRERATTRLDVELVINKEERLLDFHNR